MKSSVKITLIYLSISFLWILFSDMFIQTLSNDPHKLTQLQTYKGWFFVLSTSVFLFMMIDRKIHKMNKIRDELERAKIKAEESDRLKTAFLSNMSHEIRTPLNGILGFSNLLCEEKLEKKDYELYINQINRNGQLLLKIINDIIEISKIQENMIAINPITFDFHHIFNNLSIIYNSRESKLIKKGLEFRIANDISKGSLSMHTDPERVLQILINLIENAIKYTDSGYIQLQYEQQEQQLLVHVEDSGTGINKDDLSRIFERFNQSTVKSDVQGFGLGLSISRGLAQALGGNLSVESELGKGSRFTVQIPLIFHSAN